MTSTKVSRLAAFGVVAVLAAFLLVATVPHAAFAQTDPFIGTWKLNLAKSKFDPGPAPKSQTVKTESVAGGAMKSTFDGVNAQGQVTHSERVTKLDGKEVPIQAIQPPTTSVITAAYKRIDGHTYEVVNKADGKVTTTNRVVVSRDGKTSTATTTGKNAQGQTVNNVAVYDKR